MHHPVIDTHTHTLVSGHAYGTIRENAAAAEAGMEMIVATEHGPDMVGAPIPLYFLNMAVLPRTIHGVTVLRGIEANIVGYDGRLDLSDALLERLDFVIAAFHDIVLSPCGAVEANTRAMIAAIRHPLVDVIAHPGNPAFQIDIPKVVAAAAEHGKLLEINNNSINVRKGSQENCTEIARLCAESRVPVVCASDAHDASGVGRFPNSLKLLESVNFPEALLLNNSVESFVAHLQGVRKRDFTGA